MAGAVVNTGSATQAITSGGNANVTRAIARQAPFAERAVVFDRAKALENLTARFVVLHLASGRKIAVRSDANVTVFSRKERGKGVCVSKQAQDVMECDMVPEARRSISLTSSQRESLLSRDPVFSSAFRQLFVDTGSTRLPVFCAELHKALAAKGVSPFKRAEVVLEFLTDSHESAQTPTRSIVTVEKWLDGSRVSPLFKDLRGIAQALAPLESPFFTAIADGSSAFLTHYREFTSAIWALNLYVSMLRREQSRGNGSGRRHFHPDGEAAKALAHYGVQLRRLLQECGSDDYILAQVNKMEFVDASKLSNVQLRGKLEGVEQDAPCTKPPKDLGLGEVPMSQVYDDFKVFEAAAACLVYTFLINELTRFPSRMLWNLVYVGIHERMRIPFPAQEETERMIHVHSTEAERAEAKRLVEKFFREVDSEVFERRFQQHNIPEGTVRRFLRQLEIVNKALPRLFYTSCGLLQERFEGPVVNVDLELDRVEKSLKARYGIDKNCTRQTLLMQSRLCLAMATEDEQKIWHALNDPLEMMRLMPVLSRVHTQGFFSRDEIAEMLDRHGVWSMVYFFPHYSFPQ